jgi:hypothetical protein
MDYPEPLPIQWPALDEPRCKNIIAAISIGMI